MSPETQRSTPQASHLSFLDGLRALAALQVVLGHATLHVDWGADPPPLLLRAALWPMSFAREAVALFIVLSGFCLMLPVVRHGAEIQGGAWQFFKRRARRILPPYYFALAISLLLIWTVIGQKTNTHWDASLPADGKAIWTHLLLLQDVFQDTSARINHVMWSTSVEWRIYFLFPLLVLCWRRAGAVISTVAAVAGSYLLIRYVHFEWLNTAAYGTCLHFIGLFALGMLGAGVVYSDDRQLAILRKRVPWRAVSCVLVVAFVAARDLRMWWGGAMPWYLRDYLVGVFSMSLMIFAASNSGSMIHRALAWRPLTFVGMFGYSLYLMHAPCLQLLSQYVIGPLGLPPILAFCSLVLVGTPAIVLLCYVFYLFCERPFLNTPVRGAGQSTVTRPKFAARLTSGVRNVKQHDNPLRGAAPRPTQAGPSRRSGLHPSARPSSEKVPK